MHKHTPTQIAHCTHAVHLAHAYAHATTQLLHTQPHVPAKHTQLPQAHATTPLMHAHSPHMHAHIHFASKPSGLFRDQLWVTDLRSQKSGGSSVASEIHLRLRFPESLKLSGPQTRNHAQILHDPSGPGWVSGRLGKKEQRRREQALPPGLSRGKVQALPRGALAGPPPTSRRVSLPSGLPCLLRTTPDPLTQGCKGTWEQRPFHTIRHSMLALH